LTGPTSRPTLTLWGYGSSWKPFVMVELIQRQMDEAIRATPVERRMRWHVEMYQRAFDQVWAQADRAGPMSELERAEFLIRRLYPDWEGPQLDSIMRRLTAEWEAGTWHGPRRRSWNEAE
jgi:hypothetical protein